MFCEICGANAPNRLYCINCGAYRPKASKEPVEPEPATLKIMVGERVAFTYYGRARVAKIAKVLRVNVVTRIVTRKGKRKLVTVPIKNLRVPT